MCVCLLQRAGGGWRKDYRDRRRATAKAAKTATPALWRRCVTLPVDGGGRPRRVPCRPQLLRRRAAAGGGRPVPPTPAACCRGLCPAAGSSRKRRRRRRRKQKRTGAQSEGGSGTDLSTEVETERETERSEGGGIYEFGCRV